MDSALNVEVTYQIHTVSMPAVDVAADEPAWQLLRSSYPELAEAALGLV